MVRTLALPVFCLAILGIGAARAQIAPATTQELQQQAGQTIQQSTDALRRDMDLNTQAHIQQRQDEQRLFSPVTNPSVAPNMVNPLYQPYSYQPYDAMLPPPLPKKTEDRDSGPGQDTFSGPTGPAEQPRHVGTPATEAAPQLPR